MVPERFALQVPALDEVGESVAFAYADIRLIDEAGRPIASAGDASAALQLPRQLPTGRIYDALLEQCFVPAPTAIIRTSALKAVGPFRRVVGARGLGHVAASVAPLSSPVPADLCSAFYRQVEGSLFATLSTSRLAELHDTQGRLLAKHLGGSRQTDRALARRIRDRGWHLWSVGHPGAAHLLGVADAARPSAAHCRGMVVIGSARDRSPASLEVQTLRAICQTRWRST